MAEHVTTTRAQTEPVGGVGVFAAVAVAALAASPLHLPLNNPNEGVRVFTVKALVEHRTFAIDEVVRAWGYIDDKAQFEGRLFSSKAPLMSMMGAAVYAVVHPVTGDLSRTALTRLCRFAADALPTLAVAWCFGRALRRRCRDAAVADLVTVGSVLGSGVLASMHVFSGHALAALAPATALLLCTETQPRPWHLPVAGLLLAVAVGAEYPALLACVPVVVAAVVLSAGRRPAALGALTAGALPVVVAVSWAHTAMFGAPWKTGYSFLENHHYRGVVAGTLFGIGAPRLDVLSTVLWSPELGLFFYSPMLLVGAAWMARTLARRPSSGTHAWIIPAAAAVGGMLVFIAGFRGWRGGWSVGPRYISELIGLLAVPTAVAFDAWSVRQPVAARAALAALVMLGIVHSGIAGLFFPHLSDVYRNPVYEMMVPVVLRGASPDSLFLMLGTSPATSAALLLVLLGLPVVVALGAHRRTRAAWAPSAVAAAAVVVAAAIGPHLARTDPGRAAAETERLLRNWRPEAGVPEASRALQHDPAQRTDATWPP